MSLGTSNNSKYHLDVFSCSRRGDIERLKYLLEEKEINVNVRDQWDSTPLYYACLCGHREAVEYLLASGARCDASTFDGERCIYGALTEDIRKLLLDFAVLTSTTKRREPHQEFLRKLLEDSDHADFTFRCEGDFAVPAHRFVLCCRSPYFASQFAGGWREKRAVSLKGGRVDRNALALLLEWLYTGRAKVEVDLTEDLSRLARRCRLPTLEEELGRAAAKAYSFVSSKRGSRIRHLQLESDTSAGQLEADLGALAERALVAAGSEEELDNAGDQEILDGFDLVFVVVFSKRSDYFQALLANHFQEASSSNNSSSAQHHQTTLTLNGVRPEVFAEVVRHVYSDNQEMSPDTVYELLEAADMFLLPGLKRQCGSYLGSGSGLLEVDTAADLVRTARLFDLPRLEHLCVEFMAKNIEQIVSDEAFRSLVMEDASGVVGRQETDSIDIVDEIRFVIRTEGHSSLSSATVGEAVAKMELIDEMLAELGFGET